MSADFIKNLPEGITYHDPEADSYENDKMQQRDTFLNDDEKEGDIVRVGDFTINIEVVTKAQLISMRKFLPSEQYRLLKNRKSARLCRRKRKEERGDMQKDLDVLKKENSKLKEKLEETEKLLKEKERALEMHEMHQQMLENQIINTQASIANNVGNRLGDTSNVTP